MGQACLRHMMAGDVSFQTFLKIFIFSKCYFGFFTEDTIRWHKWHTRQTNKNQDLFSPVQTPLFSGLVNHWQEFVRTCQSNKSHSVLALAEFDFFTAFVMMFRACSKTCKKAQLFSRKCSEASVWMFYPFPCFHNETMLKCFCSIYSK